MPGCINELASQANLLTSFEALYQESLHCSIVLAFHVEDLKELAGDPLGLIGKLIVLLLCWNVRCIHELEAIEQNLQHVDVLVLDRSLQLLIDDIEYRFKSISRELELDFVACNLKHKFPELLNLDLFSFLDDALDLAEKLLHLLAISSGDWRSLQAVARAREVV